VSTRITEVEKDGEVFRLGDLVRVRGWTKTAKITHFYVDVNGGCILDREIGGYRSWNVEDMSHAPKLEQRTKRNRRKK
jgi:hypothetical protein